MIFVFVWAILVYCPIAYWAWHPQGWIARFPRPRLRRRRARRGLLGLLRPHLLLGAGSRRDDDEQEENKDKEKGGESRRPILLVNYRPNNVSLVLLGTALLAYAINLLPGLRP